MFLSISYIDIYLVGSSACKGLRVQKNQGRGRRKGSFRGSLERTFGTGRET